MKKMNWDNKNTYPKISKKRLVWLNENLDLKPLQRAIRKKTDCPQIKITGEVGVGSGKPNITFRSQDIKELAGCLGKTYAKLQVRNFGSNIYVNTDDEFVAWVSVHFSWDYLSRGSNGLDLFDAWYNFEQKKWHFNDAAWEIT